MLDGHKRVLEAWNQEFVVVQDGLVRKDDVLVIAVLSGDGERVLAGARLQPSLVANDFPLHQAVGLKDPEVGNFLDRIIPEGAYEMNALWNSIELAGMGMGSEFLIQVAMAAMPLIEAKHPVATDPVTRRWRKSTGGICAASWRRRALRVPQGHPEGAVEHYVHPDYETHVAPEVLHDLHPSPPCGASPRVHGAKGQLNIRLNLTL